MPQSVAATISALIVDDEQLAREELSYLLTDIPDIEILQTAANGIEAVKLIEQLEPDLVFLDVQMPERDGFDVVKALPPRRLPAVLFVTAYDRYALQAFEVHAVDYLLKPFTGERFRTALDRARERIAQHVQDPALAELARALRNRPAYLSRLPIRSGGRTLFVNLDAVDWLEAADNYVRVHVGQREHLVRETLATLEAQLDPERFARIHRSAIVRLDGVAEIRPTSHGDAEVVLRNGSRLTASRTWRHRLMGG